MSEKAVEPIIASDEMGCVWYYVCPTCRFAVDYMENCCENCGTKLKWDKKEENNG